MTRTCFQIQLGGTGFQPVVSGVAPETVAGYAATPVPPVGLHRASHDEIRRDAGFNGRDARSTHYRGSQ